jgi:flagellar assembly protein FliH
MSTGNAHQEQLNDAFNAAIAEDAPTGKLEDAEIQRLVALSNDANFERTERIPVKTVEAFEPRSLVSIAMAAQRRRENEIRTAMAAGAMIEDQDAEGAAVPADGEGANAEHSDNAEAGTDAAGADAAGIDNAVKAEGDADAGDAEGVAEGEPSSTSQVDFEAGRAEGLEEGRSVGFEEGQAKGMEEGRAAGRAEASAQLERTIQAFEAASARLAELSEVDSAALGESINNAILHLASERAGHAIAELPDSFATRIESLLATIRTVSGQPSIRLNPGDLNSIQPLAETREKLRHCNFIADPTLASGDLTVMVGTIGIDDIIVPQRGEEDVEATDDLLKSQSHADAPDAADITDASDGADADTVAVMTEAQGGPEDGAEDGQDG